MIALWRLVFLAFAGSALAAACGGEVSSPVSSPGHVSCPASPPSGACPVPGLECEYGTSANPNCNTIYLCGPQGWAVMGLGACPDPLVACPASHEAASDAPCGGGYCAYPEGQCMCLGGTFQCTGPQPGCPSIRPHIGTSCDATGQSCSYTDSGDGCTGFALVCGDGVWRRAECQGG